MNASRSIEDIDWSDGPAMASCTGCGDYRVIDDLDGNGYCPWCRLAGDRPSRKMIWHMMKGEPR